MYLLIFTFGFRGELFIQYSNNIHNGRPSLVNYCYSTSSSVAKFVEPLICRLCTHAHGIIRRWHCNWLWSIVFSNLN